MPVDPRIQRLLDGPMSTSTDLRFKTKRGYAQAPGTGPIGATCGSCRWAYPNSDTKRDWYCHQVAFGRPDRGDLIALTTAACGRWAKPR